MSEHPVTALRLDENFLVDAVTFAVLPRINLRPHVLTDPGQDCAANPNLTLRRYENAQA
jgi:hypothetical protein